MEVTKDENRRVFCYLCENQFERFDKHFSLPPHGDVDDGGKL
jgi:hypothetical protein